MLCLDDQPGQLQPSSQGSRHSYSNTAIQLVEYTPTVCVKVDIFATTSLHSIESRWWLLSSKVVRIQHVDIAALPKILYLSMSRMWFASLATPWPGKTPQSLLYPLDDGLPGTKDDYRLSWKSLGAPGCVTELLGRAAGAAGLLVFRHGRHRKLMSLLTGLAALFIQAASLARRNASEFIMVGQVARYKR
jgi:hypothetical protein